MLPSRDGPTVIEQSAPAPHPLGLDTRIRFKYWRKQPTDDIIESLKPGKPEALMIKPDGRIMNGNTRIKVLEERGVDVDSLPREVLS